MISIYFHKLLPIFLLPIGLTLLMLMLGLALKRKKIVFVGILTLWLSSSNIFSERLMAWAESPYQRVSPQDAKETDAIVALSAGRVVAPGPLAISEWQDADRFYGATELFKADKAPLLIFTGAWVPWEPNAKPEGQILAAYAQQLGVPRSKILITGVAQNTAEEAMVVKEALKNRYGPDLKKFRILLVTSAYHMERSRTLFEREGFDVEPFAVDFQVSRAKEFGVLDILPSAEALKQTEMAWRELLGRAYYFFKLNLQ